MLYNFNDVDQFQPGAPPGRQKLIEELRLPEGSFVLLNNDLFLGTQSLLLYTKHPKSAAKDVERTVRSAEVFAEGRSRETSAVLTISCTSLRLHSIGM